TRKLPISARPDTFSYRASTFVRRHRAAVLATALTLLALMAGIVTTWHLARAADVARDRAERRFNDVRSLANTLLFDLHDAIRDLPGATPARRLLVANARIYLDSLLRESAGDASLQAELAEAYLRVGEIEGDPHFPNLGDLDAATASYRESVRLHTELAAIHPEDAGVRQALAVSLGRLAVVQSWGGANIDAIASSTRALTILDSLSGIAPQNTTIRLDIGRIQSELGWWLIWAGRVAEGLAQLDLADEILEDAVRRHPDHIGLGIDRWRAVSYRVDGLTWSDAKAEALELLARDGCPLLANLDRRFPNHPRILSSFKACVYKLGNLYIDFGQTEAGIDALRRSLALAEDLARSDSTNIQGLRGIAIVHEALGSVYRSLGETDLALGHFQEALTLKKTLFALDPDHAEAGNTLANTQRSLCTFFYDAGQPARALAYCQDALERLRGTVAQDPGNAIGRESLATTYVETARVHAALSREVGAGDRARHHRDAAIQFYDRALDEMGRLSSAEFSRSISPDSVAAERDTFVR
ncbi:MAG: hypothetical protein R2834_21750, partial [Rhodothermales bacterium]